MIDLTQLTQEQQKAREAWQNGRRDLIDVACMACGIGVADKDTRYIAEQLAAAGLLREE